MDKLKWTEAIYNECQFYLRGGQTELMTCNWKYKIKQITEAFNHRHLPECLFVHTLVHPHSLVSTYILEGLYTSNNNNQCFKMTSFPSTVIIENIIMPGLFRYTYGVGERKKHSEVFYFKWGNIYYVQYTNWFNTSQNSTTLLDRFCKGYCHLYEILNLLKHQLVDDVSQLVLPFLDMDDFFLDLD